MAEINGYLLTKEEEKECIALVKWMRERKTYAINFSGCVRIKAKTRKEATDIFWGWISDMQDKTLTDWHKIITFPYLKNISLEEE